MRQIGLRAEVLFNILFITAAAMLLIGVIAFKLTERYEVQGKIDGIKSTITALEDAYLDKNSEEGRGTLFEIIFPAARNYEHAENFGG